MPIAIATNSALDAESEGIFVFEAIALSIVGAAFRRP
jgi:hypothetical protein